MVVDDHTGPQILLDVVDLGLELMVRHVNFVNYICFARARVLEFDDTLVICEQEKIILVFKVSLKADKLSIRAIKYAFDF